MGFVLAPSWRRARVLTDAELTELRYAGRPAAALRAIKAVYFGTIFNCTVLAMVLFAATEIAEPFLHWNQWLPAFVFEPVLAFVKAVGVPFARELSGSGDLWIRSANNLISIGMIAAVTLLYSATGGLRSVVQTDLVQFAIMLLATAGYAGWVIHEVGGLAAITDQIHQRFATGGPAGILPEEILAFTPDRAKDASFVVLAVFALQWLVQMNADGTGYLAQRSMACRSDRDAKEAAVVFTAAQVVLRSLLWLPIGLGLLVLFPPSAGTASEALWADREATFVRGIAELLPPGLSGLMLTAMLAALASTVDTHLNWGSSYWTNDLYKRFFCVGWLGREPSGRSLVWVARVSNLLILAIGLVIMSQLSSIQLAWQVSLLLGAGMGVLLVLRWLWWRLNAWGEIAAIAASMVLAPILLLLPDESEALWLLLIPIGSTLAGIGASLISPAEPVERLQTFYARARPPGFWEPVARSLGENGRESRARLGRGLAAMAVAALSFFSLLTGAGSWIAGSPPPGFFHARGLWIASLAVVGIALIPVWWKLAFGGTDSGARPSS
jgi:Na+/proline symporter